MFFVIKNKLSPEAEELQRTGLVFSLSFSLTKEDYSSMITGVLPLKEQGYLWEDFQPLTSQNTLKLKIPLFGLKRNKRAI